MTAGAGAEFSRPFRLSQLGPEPCEMSFSPGPEECRALARRFDLVAISQFDCTASIRALADDGQYELTGRFVARLQQACVVTLEPVDARLEESFRLRLQRLEPAVEDASRPEPASRKAELIFDADEDDVEPVIGEDVDLGEIFAQYLPNSQWASMTSSPLLTRVAESTVMRDPIRQVGCCSTSSGVALERRSRGQSRSAPPEAVSTTLTISSGERPCKS